MEEDEDLRDEKTPVAEGMGRREEHRIRRRGGGGAWFGEGGAGEGGRGTTE